MSTTKKTQRRKNSSSRTMLIWLIAVLAVMLVILLAVVLSGALGSGSSTGVATGNFAPVTDAPGATLDNVTDVDQQMDKGLVVQRVASYTGIYMEDGSDEVVSKVLAIVVTNTGSATIQYAQVQLSDGVTTANFTISTLPPGETLVALETGRMSYEEGQHLTQITAQNIARFTEEPTLCEDKIKLQALNGVVNVTNISGEDITGDVVIYYKNYSADTLYGGITYRVTISGGIAAGEIRQITASHFTESGTRVMWVTVG